MGHWLNIVFMCFILDVKKVKGVNLELQIEKRVSISYLPVVILNA